MADGRRDESEKERLDRNLEELVGELRVALPGVQVLFAFLLVVPFNQRFTQVSQFEKTTYLVTLLLTATAFLIAPSAHHRIEFRQGDKAHVVFLANRFAIVGFAFLAAATTGVVLLVTSFLFSDTTATLATLATALLLFTLWYAVPLARVRGRGGRDRPGEEHEGERPESRREE